MIQREIDYRERQAYVRRVARAIARGDRQLADDLEQDAMLVSLSSSPDNPNLWRGWLRSVTRNTLRYQRFRSAQLPLHAELPDDGAAPASPTAERPDEAASSAELTGKLGELLGRLPDTYRDVVRLRVLEELPPAAVAERLGITPEAVRTRHHRGLKLLREDAERTLGKDSLPAWRGWIGMLLGAIRDRPLRSLGLAAVPMAAVAIWTVAAIAGEDDGGEAGLLNVDVELADASSESGGDRLQSESLNGSARALGTPSVDPLESEWVAAGQASAGGHLALQVEVVDTSGKPMPEAEVYVRHGVRGRVEHLGMTGADGSLSVDVLREESWLAARGEPGRSSRAVLANQPLVSGADGRITLTMNDIVVDWFNVRLHEDLRREGVQIYGARRSPESMTVLRLGDGLIGASSWLPVWRDGEDRLGALEVNNIFFVARDEDGTLLWASDLHRLDSPLPDEVYAPAPVEVRGRVMTDEGVPAADLTVGVALADRGNAAVLSATTDAMGEFTIPVCPRTEVVFMGPAGILGRTELRRRGGEAPTVDIGTLDLHECEFSVRLAGAESGATVRALARKSRSIPSVLRTLGGDSLAETRLAPGESRLRWEGLALGNVEALLVEAGEGDASRVHLEPCPKGGWGNREHFLSVANSAPAIGTAWISLERLPIEARWVEVETGLTMAAEVDEISGEIRSVPLPAGTWEIQVLDRFGVHQTSAAKGLLPGATVDFGEVLDRSGSLRLSLPVEHDLEDRFLGLVRVASLCGRASKRVFIPKGEKLPSFVDLDLPPLTYSITLLINTRTFVALADVTTGQVKDVRVSDERFILQLANLKQRLAEDADLAVVVVTPDGKRHGWRDSLASALHPSGEVVVTMPRFDEARIVLENREGVELGTAPMVVTDLGFQRVRF
ncbi:MAG: sigma-70 family RNA polymerase sigma factor [Planctomycetota bacterium]